MASAKRLKSPRCGCREMLGFAAVPVVKLSTNRPLVFVRDTLPGRSRDDIWAWILEGYQRWAAVCDWQGERIGALSEARAGDVVHLITVADLGGDGVLADQQLPFAGARVLVMRINGRVRWKPTDGAMSSGTIDPIRTLTHEVGHCAGLQHFPVGAPPELMEPSISDVLRPQPTEARVMAGWFGEPKTAPPPPPGLNKITLAIQGKNLQVSAPGWTVNVE